MSSRLLQRTGERLSESGGKHKVEKIVHVLGENGSECFGEHADALEDGILRRRVLLSGNEKREGVSERGERFKDRQIG